MLTILIQKSEILNAPKYETFLSIDMMLEVENPTADLMWQITKYMCIKYM